MRSTLLRMGASLVGGAVATGLALAVMKRVDRLPRPLRPQQPSRDPGLEMISRGERRFGALPAPVKSVGAQLLQWGYGMTGPLALGIVSSKLGVRSPVKTLLAGAGLGALVWAIGYAGWLPALRLVPPVHKVPMQKNAAGLLHHVVYGAMASVPLAIAAPRLDRT